MKHPDAVAHTSFSRPFRFRSFFVCLVVLLLAVFTLFQTGERVVKAGVSRTAYKDGINLRGVPAGDAGLDTLRIDADTFENTGSLNTARYLHTATLLPNGKVLVAGGFNTGLSSLASSELYDLTTAAIKPARNCMTR